MFSNPPVSPFKKVGSDKSGNERKHPLFYKEGLGEITKTYLKIGFLCFFRHSGLDPESSDSVILLYKTENYELPFKNTRVAGYRLSPV
jgi:hypothetical protein